LHIADRAGNPDGAKGAKLRVVEQLRREPFRLLFPLGVLLAWLAIIPWVLFGTGVIRGWLGSYHALTMTQGFLVAISVGFLGTLIPRRTGASPMSSFELLLCVAALASVPLWLLGDQLLGAQVAYLMVLATLAQFAIRRMRVAKRPAPPSFVFLPIGMVAGGAGAALIGVSTLGGPGWTLGTGRSLVEEGLLLCLVMALAPMLTPLICHGAAPPDPEPAAARRARAWHLLAAALLLLSFALQSALPGMTGDRVGLLVRGAVVAAHLLIWAHLLRPPTVPGLHRRLFRVALACVPLGLLAAGARPAYRIPLMHVTFIGGFSLLVFAVSLHVVFLHTGREALAARVSLPVWLVGGLTVAAALARATAEQFASHYVEALAVASSLWLLAALVWGVLLVSMVVRRPRPGPAP